MYIQPKRQQWLDYLVDKKDNANFADAPVIDVSECKTLWIRGSIVTGVTCHLTFTGGLTATALTQVPLASTQTIAATASAGTASISGNDIVLAANFAGSFLLGIKDPPPFLRIDETTYSAGGGNGNSGGPGGNGLDLAIWGTSL